MISLQNHDYNTGDPLLPQNATRNLLHHINNRKETICVSPAIDERADNPQLQDGLDDALQQFSRQYGDSDFLKRMKHILVFSDCAATLNEQNQVCSGREMDARYSGVTIIMVNNLAFTDNIPAIDRDDEYLRCLVDNDLDHIIDATNPFPMPNDHYQDEIVPLIKMEVIEEV